MQPDDPTPLDPAAAVEHPRYDSTLLQEAAGFLKVPPGIEGRALVSLLYFGSAEEIKDACVTLKAGVTARDAAKRIDLLARYKLAITPTCPLTEAFKLAGIPVPPPDVLERMKRIVGVKPGDKVQIVAESEEPEDEHEAAVKDLLASLDGAMQDDDHGLPIECFMALQRRLPGIRVVQRKVIACPTLPVPVAQAILDMTLAKAKRLGLI